MSQPTRVAAGTPVGRLLRASKINYVLEGAELAHALTTGAPAPRPIAGRGGAALVKNNTGGRLDRFSVLGLTDILIDPATSEEAEDEFNAHFAFVGQAPDADRDGPGRFAITQAPVDDGDLVLCVINGLSVCTINKGADQTYTGASLITDDTDKLDAVDGGDVPVLWHADGTGAQLAVINLGGGTANTIRFAKLNTTLAAGSLSSPATATAEFYDSDSNDPPQLSVSGTTFTVVNYSTDYTGSTGDFIIVARIQGVWHVLAADC